MTIKTPHYRLIASDLDETALNDARSVSERDRAALRRAWQAGVKFVIATGRPFASVTQTLEETGQLGKAGEYVISYNGGAITENDGTLLYCDRMDFDLINTLYKIGREKGYVMHIYSLEHTYTANTNDWDRAYVAGRLDTTEIDTEDLTPFKDEHFIKILFADPDLQKLYATERELSVFKDRLDMTYSSNRYLEFNNKGTSKGEGLKKLAAHLNIPIEQTIAVGDNFNDLPMIKAAGLGLAVENAADGVQARSDGVLKADNNHNPLTEIVDTYIF